MQLQADVDRIQGAVSFTREVIQLAGTSTCEVQDTLESLEALHVKFGKDIDHLYTSLDIPQRFPTLQGVNLDFVHTLLLARDLKIDI